MTKNVAGTCRRLRTLRISGVHRGSGPSSNVRATVCAGGIDEDWAPRCERSRTGPAWASEAFCAASEPAAAEWPVKCCAMTGRLRLAEEAKTKSPQAQKNANLR